jgi:hypothetical protein
MERIKGALYPPLNTEIEAIKTKNEQEQDAELWSPDSLSYRYFNLL